MPPRACSTRRDPTLSRHRLLVDSRLTSLLTSRVTSPLTSRLFFLLTSRVTAETHEAVLRAAIHKSKREVEMQVAALRPFPQVPVVIRRLPQPRALSDEVPPAAEAIQSAPAPMTATELRAAVMKAPVMRHSVPDGDLAVIVDRALNLLLERLEKQKCGSLIHRTFAADGATDAANLTLRCRAHNQYEAELIFGLGSVRESTICYSSHLLFVPLHSVRTELSNERATGERVL